ncbi:hypothetical protein [Vibrio tapetis]|uniref:Uncharacterized protein n=1 Tax=Vibrio tapetis subsp. tapetis TaxID=1671868 RepID=A0A2N8Z9H4_9VIBR|nr:hypothetical protein [Vibrio tapetis]SON48537.1 conserved protein of unknown function [Vibrio tapetis subsp. tapetis]
MSDDLNWRALSVNRDKKYEHLVKKFASPEQGKTKVFKNIKDFMVFAALVAYEADKYIPLKAEAKVSISLETYANTEHDSYIYLLALTKSPNIDALKGESLALSIKHFEAYCNAGLEIIDSWNVKHTYDDSGFEMLFDESFEHIASILDY